MNARTVGLELARARRRAGLTQAALARRMGTTQSAVARAEAGRTFPSLRFIERVAAAAGWPIVLAFGKPGRADRSARVRRALGGFRFDPWERDPSPAEARALVAMGVSREPAERA